MRSVKRQPVGDREPAGLPCLCGALRQASRAVTRIYDEEFRAFGLRAGQYGLLRLLERSGEVRQRDLGALAALDETTLTRNLRPLEKGGWVAIRAGGDRREKLVAITEAGRSKVEEARPAWARAQDRIRGALPDGAWDLLFEVLPGLTRAALSPRPGGDS